MARSQSNKPEGEGSPNGEDKPAELSAVTLFSTPKPEGETIAEMFSVAHSACGIGHRTYSNVPFVRLYKEGDVMTAAQAAFLSTQVLRASLGNDDYDSLEDAANIKVRPIPAQYSLLEDAADNIVLRMMEARNAATGRRVDRESNVAAFLGAKRTTKLKGSEQTVADAIAAEIASLINARKSVKGKAATEAAKVDTGSFFDEAE